MTHDPEFERLLAVAIQARAEVIAATLTKTAAQAADRRWMEALHDYLSRHPGAAMYTWSESLVDAEIHKRAEEALRNAGIKR